MESSCPGELLGVFDFILGSAEKAKWALFLKFTHHQVCNYRAEKTIFWHPSLYNERLGTQYGWIHNQYTSANTMTPSIAKNLFFRGFPTWLIDLSMDFVWECALCCNSTVNIYRCGTVTQLQYGWYCVEQFKGYLLLHNVLQKLWVLMVVFFCVL